MNQELLVTPALSNAHQEIAQVFDRHGVEYRWASDNGLTAHMELPVAVGENRLKVLLHFCDDGSYTGIEVAVDEKEKRRLTKRV